MRRAVTLYFPQLHQTWWMPRGWLTPFPGPRGWLVLPWIPGLPALGLQIDP